MTFDDLKQRASGIHWGHFSYRSVVLGALAFGGTIAWDTNADIARVGQQVISHITRHPDAGLRLLIDRQQEEIDELEERLRWVEIETRTTFEMEE